MQNQIATAALSYDFDFVARAVNPADEIVTEFMRSGKDNILRIDGIGSRIVDLRATVVFVVYRLPTGCYIAQAAPGA